jgi:uncharacterized membrane protein
MAVDFLRHHRPHAHLHGMFGDDLFGRLSEGIAVFFGTPQFIGIQTVVVAGWVLFNLWTGHPFDPYPFVFLNLIFSTQAAYASPFILLAAKRQADRDKAQEFADAAHRDEIHNRDSAIQESILQLLQKNTELTEKIETLTREVHELTVKDK